MSAKSLRSAPPIRVEELQVKLGGESILRDVTLELEAGRILGVVGPSGSGKSVLMKTVLGLIPSSAGRCEVFGVDTARAPEASLERIRSRWGVAFQQAALFSSLTVSENVQVPLRHHFRMPRDLVNELTVLRIRMVGLEADSCGKLPEELSGGMRKRVGVARGIALQPQVILYDEPTTGLDPANQRRIGELIVRLQRELGVTSVVVTHELELCFAISDRVALLRRGRIEAEGSADEMQHSDNEAVRAFLDGSRDEANGESERPGDSAHA